MKRAALVTGASGALGGAVARELAERGYAIGLAFHRNREAAERLADEIEDAHLLGADLAQRGAAWDVVRDFLRRFERLSVLVHCAGVAHEETLLRTREEDWDRVQAVNLDAAFRLLRAAGRPLCEEAGCAVLVSSHAGARGAAGASAYAAAKAALTGLARSVAAEWGESGARVHVVLPGFLPTSAMGRSASDAFARRAAAESLLGRTGEVRRAARFIADLPALRPASGQVYALDSRPVP